MNHIGISAKEGDAGVAVAVVVEWISRPGAFYSIVLVRDFACGAKDRTIASSSPLRRPVDNGKEKHVKFD